MILTFSFGFLQIGFTEYLANYTEAIRLNRRDLSKFNNELYDTGFVMCEYGVLSFGLAFLAFFIAVKLGQSLSDRWKNAYLYAVFHKPLTWHDKTHHETLSETIENDCFTISKLPEKALIVFLGLSLYFMC